MSELADSGLLNFEEEAKARLTKKLTTNFVGEISSWYETAAKNTNDFYQLVLDDPQKGIKEIPQFIMKARDTAGPGSHVWEALAGGANYDWTGPVLDVVGIIYPDLPPDIRKEALLNVLDFIDKQNYSIAQENVAMINEPWLVADIILNRSLYWCGYQEYIDLTTKYPTWSQLYPHLDQVKSAFWMAMAISRPKYTNDNIRENFYRRFPILMDKTCDAIAAITETDAKNSFLRYGEPIEQNRDRYLFMYDHTSVPAIRKKIDEAKWTDLDEPYYVYWKVKGQEREEHEYRYRSKINEYAEQLSLLNFDTRKTTS